MTPLEALIKKRPQLAHLHLYGCRAYPLRRDLLRLNKLEPRAMISYLIGYNSSNIYRIWIPSQIRVIRTRDVMFNYSRFFDPAELDIGHISAVNIEDTIKVLDMPAPSYAASRDVVEEDNSDDTIKVYSSPIGESMAEATPEEEEVSLDEEEMTQQMVTPDPTPDRENGHSTDSAGETRATRRPASYAEVPPDAVAMALSPEEGKPIRLLWPVQQN
jgi:hypothetical protein